jgi:hypothetical protein
MEKMKFSKGYEFIRKKRAYEISLLEVFKDFGDFRKMLLTYSPNGKT